MQFKWKPQDIFNDVSDYLEKQPDNKEITVFIANKETKEMKTRFQEQFYYWMLSEIEKQTPFSAWTIKQYLLWRVFGKKEMFWELVNNKTETSSFTRKEAVEFIESVQMFIEENSLHCKYISRDMQSLYLTYNN